MRKMFKELSVGEKFRYQGNDWVKQSGRTAEPLFSAFAKYYYFGQSDNCYSLEKQ